MRVAALFRYPVKGFTREECDALEVLPGGRIAGDRVLGLRLNDSPALDDAWSTKLEFVAVVNTPGLTALRLKFDHKTLRLRIELAGEVLLDDVLDNAGRRRFASVVEQYVVGLDENPVSSRMSRLPLRVVGDGITPRYRIASRGTRPCTGAAASLRLQLPSTRRPFSPRNGSARISPLTVRTPGRNRAGWAATCASAIPGSRSPIR